MAAPASAQPKTVEVDDLDLATPAGQHQLNARIQDVAKGLCHDAIATGTLLGQNMCQQAVRKEVLAKLEERQNQTGKGG
jgi:UrcA family protein